MGCLRLFALCSANTYSPFLFSRASSSAQIASSCLSDGAHSPSLCAISGFSSPRRSLKWLCFPTAIQWHPQPVPAKEVCLPKLEPGPVYSNSSEKYGRIIILVVSFNVTSLWWQPLHAVSATLRVAWWSSDQGVVWMFLQRPVLFCDIKELLDGKKLEQYGARQINTKHKAVMEFAVVVPRINADSKYCTAGRAQTLFSELSSVAERPCSIPVWPQAQKNTL